MASFTDRRRGTLSAEWYVRSLSRKENHPLSSLRHPVVGGVEHLVVHEIAEAAKMVAKAPDANVLCQPGYVSSIIALGSKARANLTISKTKSFIGSLILRAPFFFLMVEKP